MEKSFIVYLKTMDDGKTYIGHHNTKGMRKDGKDYVGGGKNLHYYITKYGLHFAKSTQGKTKLHKCDFNTYNKKVDTKILANFTTRKAAMKYEAKMVHQMQPDLNIYLK